MGIEKSIEEGRERRGTGEGERGAEHEGGRRGARWKQEREQDERARRAGGESRGSEEEERGSRERVTQSEIRGR